MTRTAHILFLGAALMGAPATALAAWSEDKCAKQERECQKLDERCREKDERCPSARVCWDTYWRNCRPPIRHE